MCCKQVHEQQTFPCMYYCNMADGMHHAYVHYKSAYIPMDRHDNSRLDSCFIYNLKCCNFHVSFAAGAQHVLQRAREL